LRHSNAGIADAEHYYRFPVLHFENCCRLLLM